MQRVRTAHGVRFVVRYYEGGRGSARRKVTFDRREDAVRFETEIRRRKQLGQDLYAEVRGSEQTVREFTVEWWDRYAVSRLAPGTLATYVYVLDRWLVPMLGRVRLRDLSRDTVDELVAGMVRAGAGAPTINRALGVLQGIMRRAVEWRRISVNPVVGVARVPHMRDQAIRARAPEQVEQIRARLDRQDAALVSVLAYEGLRPAETFALEWRDVLDPSGRPGDRLMVERAADGTTKTYRARQPELFGPVARDLAELYLAVGRPRSGALVFPSSSGGSLSRHNWRARVWKPALAAAGLDYFRPYDLRHTCATLLIYEGRALTEVAAHLGHAVERTSVTYAHVLEDAAGRRGVPITEAIMQARRAVRSATG